MQQQGGSPFGTPPPPPPPSSDSQQQPMMTEAVGSNRWPQQETDALLKIRSDMESLFRDASLKGPLWEEVSRKLGELGYRRSGKKCKEKFENVQKYYKRTKDGRAGRQDGKSYRFFNQLEALHSTVMATNNQNLNPSTSFPPPQQISAPTPIATAPPPPPPQHHNIELNTSTDESDSEDDDFEDESKKRKRELREDQEGCKKMMGFFEGLMRQVMERQEAMQQRLLEAIKKRDQDRAIRDEAWRRQETARVAREQSLAATERANAAARDAAVISFLQKFSGQTIPTPPPPPPPTEIVAWEPQEGTSQDPASSRWPKTEVHALIKLRSELDTRYHETGPKGPLWEEISAGMKRLGYNRSSKRCKEKWENINKYFKRVKENNKKRPEDAKTCPYFHQLDALYRSKNALGGGVPALTQNPNPVPVVTPPPRQQQHQQQQLLVNRKEIDTGKGNERISSTLLGDGNSIVKEPEDTVKDQTAGQPSTNIDEPGSDNMDEDDIYDDDEEDDEEGDGNEQYKIQFQRKNEGGDSANGGASGASAPPNSGEKTSSTGSFLAMVR